MCIYFNIKVQFTQKVQIQRHARPASYAGDAECRRGRERETRHCYVNRVPDSDHEPASRDHVYASSGSKYAVCFNAFTNCRV